MYKLLNRKSGIDLPQKKDTIILLNGMMAPVAVSFHVKKLQSKLYV